MLFKSSDDDAAADDVQLFHMVINKNNESDIDRNFLDARCFRQIAKVATVKEKEYLP